MEEEEEEGRERRRWGWVQKEVGTSAISHSP